MIEVTIYIKRGREWYPDTTRLFTNRITALEWVAMQTDRVRPLLDGEHVPAKTARIALELVTGVKIPCLG